jgi:YHS domain-containing protein
MKTWIRPIPLTVFAFLFSLLSATFSSSANASGPEDPFYKHFNKARGIAIHGYDVVSYFKGSPAQGSRNFSSEYRGVTFFFANQANMNTFDASPEAFIPAYGGWCATAIGLASRKIDINPTSYLIQEGKLFLFATANGSAKDEWLAKLPNIKQSADANWARIFNN